MNEQNMELYEKVSRLEWLLKRHQMNTRAAHGPYGDPTRGQGRVLAILKLQPQISTKDLSYLLGIRQQSMNELLNKLEKAGYVERTPSEADRRILMVRLTEKGKEKRQTETDYSGIFDCLNAEEQAVFSEHLSRIIAALEEMLGVDEDEEMGDWMDAARSRMGDAQFEMLMGMRGRFHGHGGERFGGHGRGGYGFGGRGYCDRPDHRDWHEHHEHPERRKKVDGRFDGKRRPSDAPDDQNEE